MSISTLTRIDEICSTISETYRGKDKKVILINTSDVLEGKILNFEEVENKNLRGQFKKTFKKNDILFSEIRPANKRFAFVNIDDTHNFIASTKLMVLRPNLKIVLPEFLYYILSSDYLLSEMQHLAETRSGTFPQITFSSELGPFEIELPDINCQRKIVSILKNIDKKIELNNEINDNLLNQIDSHFRALYIDFEQNNGLIPENFRYGILDELSKEIICGKTPSTKNESYYGGDIPFITIPDMHDKVYVIKTERYLSEEGANSQIKKILPKNSICVSCIETAGLVALVNESSHTNQQINSIIPKENVSPYYVYSLMKTLRDKIISLGQCGSTIVNLNKVQFSKLEVLIPTEQSMSEFDQRVKPMFEQINLLQLENEKLSSLRDSLLPKLMSGEINVDSIEL